MATDATGTPTALGIPRYDVANDAASGLGFNAAMQEIDNLLQTAPLSDSIAGIAIGSVPVWDGSAWVKPSGTPDGTKFLRDDGVWAAPAAPGTLGYGTSLPGSPSDGDTFVLVDSTTVPTYQWAFRYNASNTGTYKWEFIGGTPKVSENVSGGSYTGAGYGALSTQVTVTVPRNGIYTARYTASADWFGSNTNGERLYTDWQGAGLTAADGTASFGFQGGSQDGAMYIAKERRLTLTTASALQVYFKVWQGTGVNIGTQSLSVTPFQV